MNAEGRSWPLRRSLRVEGWMLAGTLSAVALVTLGLAAGAAGIAAGLGAEDAALIGMIAFVVLLGPVTWAAWRLLQRRLRTPRADGAVVRLLPGAIDLGGTVVPRDERLAIEARWFVGWTGTGSHRGLLSTLQVCLSRDDVVVVLFAAGDLRDFPARAGRLGARKDPGLFQGLEATRQQLWPDDLVAVLEALASDP